jgi:hypothetical protein
MHFPEADDANKRGSYALQVSCGGGKGDSESFMRQILVQVCIGEVPPSSR